MKKTVLLLSMCAIGFAANAQLTLTGTSYTQNFDNVGSGSGSTLPLTGWACYISATSTSLGTPDATGGMTFGPSTAFGAWGDTLDCPTDVFGTGFKNCASNDAGGATSAQMTCAQQEAISNRALGVRQAGSSHPGFDPGAAFTLELANTSGRTGFSLTFNLESLDTTCPRVTVWEVDYGTGATPTTFTPVTTTPSTLSTGGYTFNNTPVTVNFGTALDNKTTPVWIRIATIVASTNTLGGNGDRTTSAIDDFHLTWTGTGTSGVSNVSAQPALSLMVIGAATSDKVNLAYTAEAEGNYTLSIYDLAGRTIHNETIATQTGTQHISVNGLHLAPGMYIAKMNSGNSSSVARIMVQ
jgi:hypothetical protein